MADGNLEQAVALHGEQLRQLECRSDKHDCKLEKHDDMFMKIMYRLPIWATIVISILVGLLGIAIGVASK